MEETEQVFAEPRTEKAKKLFLMAEKYGYIHRGFSSIDYLRYAVENHGWELTAISGIKGSAKSNLLLQRGKAIYGNMKAVNEHTVTDSMQLVELLDTEQLIPWLGIDDVATIFPKILYFVDRELYMRLQINWEALRTIISCIDFTLTRKNKVATFILEDITADIICYNRIKDIKSHYDCQRWMWLRNLKDPTKMIAKPIQVENIPFPLIPDAWKIDQELQGEFVSSGSVYKGVDFFENHAYLTGITRPDFERYWARRLEIARKAHKEFKQIMLSRAQKLAQKLEEKNREIKPIETSEASKLASALQHHRWEKEGKYKNNT